MATTDRILRHLLGKIAAKKGFTDLAKAGDLLRSHWGEVTEIRRQFYIELRDLLPQGPLDLRAIRESAQSQGSFILGGHSATRARLDGFFRHEKASQLIRELIGDRTNPPNTDQIDSFVKECVRIAFHGPGGKPRDWSSAALFASVLLTAVYPDQFVDFRQDRWFTLAKNFELDPPPKGASYGKLLIWAGRIARQFATTPTFQRCFDTEHANWVVAGLAFMFAKDETDLNLVGLIRQTRAELEQISEGGYWGMEITPDVVWGILRNHNPQVILQGPPGSGKTYLAEKVVELVADSEIVEPYRLGAIEEEAKSQNIPLFWDIVQFHPSYGYEDFVRGLMTEATDQGIVFQVQDHTLAEAAKAAEIHPDIPVILILDEINRADLARVLGELIYALERERRGVPISSQYAVGDPPDRTLRLPANLYLIGTMNTADRSIALVDYAIRRRFSFLSILPRIEVVEAFFESPIQHEGDSEVADILGPRVVDLYQAAYVLFDNLSDADDVRIGHSYFLVKGNRGGENLSLVDWADAIAFRFAFEVLPMLSEYRKERRLLDGTEEIEVDGRKFSLLLNRQNETWAAVRDWLARE
jgi:hypothetical protein